MEPGPIVLPPRGGRRRKFTLEDKRRILAEAERRGGSTSEMARRHGIAAGVLFRWKQELAQPAEAKFVAVEITDANAPSDRIPGNEGHASRRCCLPK